MAEVGDSRWIVTEDEVVGMLKIVACRARGSDYEAAADYLRELNDLRMGWTEFATACFEKAIEDLENELGPPEECHVHRSAEQCAREPEECHS